MFYPSSCAFCLRSTWKRLCRQVVALFDLMASLSSPGLSTGSVALQLLFIMKVTFQEDQ